MKIIYRSLMLSFFMLGSCLPKENSNLESKEWYGTSLQSNKPIHLDKMNASAIILNFYSPFCPPCIKELPVLEKMYEQAKKLNIAMYLAVTQDQDIYLQSLAKDKILEIEKSSLSSSAKPAQAKQKISTKKKKINLTMLIAQLKKDQSLYNISIPMLIMNPNFRIGLGEIVSATPETLFFSTNPLVLKYNFIGPFPAIKQETQETKDEFQKNNKVSPHAKLQFAMKQLDKIIHLQNKSYE